MALGAGTICAVALVTMTQAVQNRKKDYNVQELGVGPSWSGSPDTSTPWKGSYPFKAEHPERQRWGERVLAASATDASTSKEACGGFMGYGDFTWCAAAMPREVESVRKELWGKKLEKSTSASKRPAGDQFVGISYGIRERDPWSEFLSNRYHVPTKLYDCFWNEDRGPMGTKDFHAKTLGSKECPGWGTVDACYEADYEPKHLCLDMTKPFLVTNDKRNLTFEPLSNALRGQKPLSVFMKMDIEGAEWEPLEWLLAHPQELAKLRTLDMEAHMQYLTRNGQQKGDTEIEYKVKIMEALAKHFATVGSTIGFEHLKQTKRWNERLAKNKTDLPEEPRVYAKTALFLDRYSISFVNRKLLEQIHH